MYLYWRIKTDLNCIGESITFHEPSFIRCYRKWVEENAYALALAEGLPVNEPLDVNLN